VNSLTLIRDYIQTWLRMTIFVQGPCTISRVHFMRGRACVGLFSVGEAPLGQEATRKYFGRVPVKS